MNNMQVSVFFLWIDKKLPVETAHFIVWFYHIIDNKYIYGTTSNLKNNTPYVIHVVKQNDTFDSLALKYYNAYKLPKIYKISTKLYHKLWKNTIFMTSLVCLLLVLLLLFIIMKEKYKRRQRINLQKESRKDKENAWSRG